MWSSAFYMSLPYLMQHQHDYRTRGVEHVHTPFNRGTERMMEGGRLLSALAPLILQT